MIGSFPNRLSLYILCALLTIPLSAKAESDSALVNNIAWSIGHEGCPVYGRDSTGRADAILSANVLRECFLRTQRVGSEAYKKIKQASDSELVKAVKEAVVQAKARYSVEENLTWVLVHERQLGYFKNRANAGDFSAIRKKYQELQSHNPDAVNALSTLSDTEILGDINRNISISLPEEGTQGPDVATLEKIAEFTAPSTVTFNSNLTLADVARKLYGTDSDAYVLLLHDANPGVKQFANGVSYVQAGKPITVPSVPGPGKATPLPLRRDTTPGAALSSISILPKVNSELPKTGVIESSVQGNLQSTTIQQFGENGEKWYMHAISADRLLGWDFGFVVPPVPTVVGVVDGGVDINQPLVKPVMWLLPQALATPDWPAGSIGYDFYESGPSPREESETSHGTHVIGLVTGRQLNAWMPSLDDYGLFQNVNAFALKVAGPDDKFDFTTAQNAIEAAFEKGIHIFNLSLDGPYSDLLNKDLSRPERINTTLFIVAAGNAEAGNPGTDLDAQKKKLQTFRNSDGSGLRNFIFVAALSDTGDLADFSNYGKSLVEIAAPGVEISSTVYPNGFGTLSGTSQAAPLVTFTAAILKAEKPDWYPFDIKQRILNTCDRDKNLETRVHNGCKLNLVKAVVCHHDLLELKDGSRRVSTSLRPVVMEFSESFRLSWAVC